MCSPATEHSRRSGATLVRRLQTPAAYDAGYLAALLVVFICRTSAAERRFVGSQAALVDTAQALVFALAAAGEILEVERQIKADTSITDVRHGED